MCDLGKLSVKDKKVELPRTAWVKVAMIVPISKSPARAPAASRGKCQHPDGLQNVTFGNDFNQNMDNVRSDAIKAIKINLLNPIACCIVTVHTAEPAVCNTSDNYDDGGQTWCSAFAVAPPGAPELSSVQMDETCNLGFETSNSVVSVRAQLVRPSNSDDQPGTNECWINP